MDRLLERTRRAKKKPADEGRLESKFLGGKIEETGASCLSEREISNLSL
jgi:hypothetical protein